METVCTGDVGLEETRSNSLISFETNISSSMICKNINQTAETYDYIKVGNCFILKPNIMESNFVEELNTVEEVNLMEKNSGKILNIYTKTIGVSYCLIIVFLVTFLFPNFPKEISFSSILFLIIGIISFSIEKQNYLKSLGNGK